MIQPVDILYQYWGYDKFRECQSEIIESVLAGHDTIGLLPTGGGKSITFQVPALMLPGLTVVITPLISLMKDQVDNLRARDIKASCLHSGMSRPERRLALDRLNLGVTKILYVSPERIGARDFVDDLKRWNVSLIVVDEAHCISQWGYDFRPPYLRISQLRQALPDVPVLALTATATPEVVADIADKLAMKNPAIYSRSFARDNISYIVRRTVDKDSEMLNILGATQGSAIVYVRSRRRAAKLAQYISGAGITADFYHAGLEARSKAAKQEEWKLGNIRVMVATNAFGMGIDKPDVRTVIHYDVPSSLEEYYQEAGRAGRDGLTSYAVMLVAKTDKAVLTKRFNEAFPGREYILMVYERACNFIEVPVGGGYDHAYQFNLTKFLATFGLMPNPTLAALHTLTRAEALIFDENMNSTSRVHITVNRRDIYDIKMDDICSRTLDAIFRHYTGLFSEYIPIDEHLVAQATNLNPQQVYESLLTLTRLGVLHYIPRSNVPALYFPTSREEPRHVNIPRSAYEDLRERAEQRMKSMVRYAFDDSECRVMGMLAYFGEANPKPCGHCDVCRSRKPRKPVDPNAAKAVQSHAAETVSRLFDENGGVISSDRLTAELAEPHLSAAIEILRRAMDDGTVKFHAETFRKIR